jgi:hypothetical protein
MVRMQTCLALMVLVGVVHGTSVTDAGNLSPKPSLNKPTQLIQRDQSAPSSNGELWAGGQYPESFFSDASAPKDVPPLQDILVSGVRIVTSDGRGSPKLILTLSGEMIRVEEAGMTLYYGSSGDFMGKIRSGEFTIEKPANPPLPSAIPLEATL